MQRLGTKLIRIMSFAVRDAEDQMEQERFRRVRELAAAVHGRRITPVHENCMNYGGMSWQHTLKLIENVPGLKLVFDTGHPVFSDDRSKPKPYPKQSAWEFYQPREGTHRLRPHQGRLLDAASKQSVFTFPGEGKADVRGLSATW